MCDLRSGKTGRKDTTRAMSQPILSLSPRDNGAPVPFSSVFPFPFLSKITHAKCALKAWPVGVPQSAIKRRSTRTAQFARITS